MKRDLLQDLILWKNSPSRKPLILRGANRVGKSWLIDELSKVFPACIKIDFVQDPQANSIFAKVLFSKKTPLVDFIATLEAYTGQKVVPGETLLYFDEIQMSFKATKMIGRLAKELPNLHVIATGSTLQYMLSKTQETVDNSQSLYLYPLSFGEFLTALRLEDLRVNMLTKNISQASHKEILELLKIYMLLGGMPEVIDAWIKFQNIAMCQEIQDKIISSYTQRIHDGFGGKVLLTNIVNVFKAIPAQLGKKFKFCNTKNERLYKGLHLGLLMLNETNLIHLCYHSSPNDFSIDPKLDVNKIKIYLSDVGLAQRMLGQTLENWQQMPMQIRKLGGIAKQFVAQELLAYGAARNKNHLYYWQRKIIGINTEIDFILAKDRQTIPIEVKSGRAKYPSILWPFLDRNFHKFFNDSPNSSYGLEITENQFNKHNNIVEIPLYGIEAWLKEKESQTGNYPIK